MKRRLLLVDDDFDVLEAYSIVLGDEYEVVTASDGAQALRELEHSPFDVVLLDLMMPILDGEGVVKELRTKGIEVPILIGSAAANVADVARKLGLPYLTKPYDVAALVKELGQLAS